MSVIEEFTTRLMEQVGTPISTMIMEDSQLPTCQGFNLIQVPSCYPLSRNSLIVGLPFIVVLLIIEVMAPVETAIL